MRTLLSYCPGNSPCDPCKKPPVIVGNLYIAGSKTVTGYEGKPVVAVNWTTWDYPTWTPITVSVKMTGTGVAAQGLLTISANVLFPGGGNSSWIPLPETSFGSCDDASKVVYLSAQATAAGGNPYFAWVGVFGPLPFYIKQADGTTVNVPTIIL